MASARPENEPLLKALRERDAASVGDALLTAQLLVPAVQSSSGELEAAARRTDDDSLEVVAFTSAEAVEESTANVEQVKEMLGGDVVLFALSLGAEALRLDPGQPHGGYLSAKALRHLSGQKRSAGDAPFEAPGEWASEKVVDGVRAQVQSDDELAGVWLADRGGRPSIVVDSAVPDPAGPINRMIAALRTLVPANISIDFVILDDSRRAEAEALGDPLT